MESERRVLKSCPSCNSSSGIREILYGLPDGPLDEATYSISGCCVSDNDPTRKCIECGWEGEYVDNIGGHAELLKAVKLPDISKMTDEEIEIHAKEIWQKLAKPKKGSDDGNSKS